MALGCYRAAGDGVPYSALLEYYARQLGPRGVPRPRYFVGVDLGQSRDPTAIAVVRRVDYPSSGEVRDPGFLPNAVRDLAS